jgi:hypothetical protein
MEEITNLDFAPSLKKLLIEYCYAIYEENAIIDDYHLLAEYNLLKKNNQVHNLYELEHFNNRLEHEYRTGTNCG